MVLRVCLGCTALFPPGLGRCPQCGADDHVEQGSAEDPAALTEEDDVPKISAAGGATIAGVPGLDNQSDREEDQSAFMADPDQPGGFPSRADRIEQAEADRAAGRDPEEELRRRQSGEQGDNDPNADPNREQGDQRQGDQRGEESDAQGSYEGLTYNEVQALCKQRGLPATGTHDDLVGRLEEDDRQVTGG